MRFSAVATVGLALLLVLLAGCGGDRAPSAEGHIDTSRTYRWKMVTTWPANFPVVQEGVEAFARDLELMSNGRLKIDVFAGGELIPALQVFDAVTSGAVEMGHGSAYYWAGKVPQVQFMSTVPFGMTAAGMNAWLYGGEGQALWRSAYEPFGAIPFPMGNTGQQMAGWFNKVINSAADLDGLKMRIPGLGGKVFAKAGGNAVLLAGSEVYTALERKTLDATEWIGPFHDLRMGLDRAAAHYYYPGWHEPGTVLELLVNTEAWNSLGPDLQRMVETAAAAANVRILARMDAANADALQTLKGNARVQIAPLPQDVLMALRTFTREALAEEAARNPRFQAIYEAYEAFRDKMQAWQDIGGYAYQRAEQETRSPPSD